jgi:hypothetical protein
LPPIAHCGVARGWRIVPRRRAGWARREEKVMGAMSDMDSDSARVVGEGMAPGLPQASGLIAKPESVGDAERNPIFNALVAPNEEDVSGLVAYSIYKQNKRAWLDDFVKATGRAPSEAETRAYIIGESTERRLITYRRLAELTLTGETTPGRPSVRRSAPSVNSATGALWALAIIVALAVLGLAIHAGYFNGAK